MSYFQLSPYYGAKILETNMFPIYINLDEVKNKVSTIIIRAKDMKCSITLLPKILEATLGEYFSKIVYGYEDNLTFCVFMSGKVSDRITSLLNSKDSIFKGFYKGNYISCEPIKIGKYPKAFSQALHKEFCDLLPQKKWLLVSPYFAFNYDLEKEVPEPFSHLVKVYTGMRFKIQWINPLITTDGTSRSIQEPQYALIIDPHHRVEPIVSLEELMNKLKWDNKKMLENFRYVIDYCPVLSCEERYYQWRRRGRSKCPYDINARLRLKKLVEIKGEKHKVTCNILVERGMKEVLSCAVVERHTKTGSRWINKTWKRPLSLLSFEPRPEVINYICKCLNLHYKMTFSKYLKLISHHITKEGKRNPKAPYERYKETYNLVKYLVENIGEIILPTLEIRLKIVEEPLRIGLGASL